MTPKTHLRIAPEASLPGEEQVGRNFFAFRLPPYKSGSHGTVLKRTLLLACMPEGVSHVTFQVFALKQESVREGKE